MPRPRSVFSKLCFQSSSRRSASSTSRRASEVRVVEVSPRDGLQNEARALSLHTKLELIERLSKTGFGNIEAGSFVSPKWVPLMAQSQDVLTHLLRRPPQAPVPIAYNFLVPNVTGFRNFLHAYTASKGAGRTVPPQTPPSSPRMQSEQKGTTRLISAQDPNEIASFTPEGQLDKDESQAQNADPGIEISIFIAATESFSRRNINCTISESLSQAEAIMSLAKEHTLRVRAYISVALGCPYEGPDVPPQRVAELARSLLEKGVDEVSIADTTGMGTAHKTRELLKALFATGVSPHDLALHFHDTYGQALVNVVVGLEHGIKVFDAAVGGLGGCPFSKGATGNASTEDLVHCLHSLGMDTGVDIEELSRIGSWISQELGRSNESRAGKAVLARLAPR